MALKKLITPVCLALISPVMHIEAQTNTLYRTVMDTELGRIFQPASGFPSTAIGAYIGAGPSSTMFAPETIKGHYGHFNHFGNAIDVQLGFPYAALREYEASEVAAGRNPIFITATYAGKKRPVLFNTYLALNSSGHPTAPSSQWVYAVNVADDRYIHFWLTKYARPAELEPMQRLNNVWLYVDGCAFSYGAYGVLDDSGKFIGGVPWDAPFPQNAAQYLTSLKYFFDHLHQLAPDIKMMTDVGTMSDPTQFQNIYQNVAGALDEDDVAWYTNPTPYMRTNFYTQFLPWFSWLGQQGKAAIIGAQLPSNYSQSELLTAFLMYEMVKGPDFFFATRDVQVPPATWEKWNAALGTPVGPYQQGPSHAQRSDSLFTRQYSNGYVYLNWTGSTQTITLPPGNWVDMNNNAVTQITIPTWRANFVTAAGLANTAAPPAIEPRTAYNITGPVTVNLTSATSGATIHYTTDGSTPTASSPVYTTPFQLNSSAVVNAVAFASGYNPSSTSSALYNVTAGAPTVQFATSSDAGYSVSTTCFPILALSSIPSAPVVVTYSVQPASGPATVGTATFTPGEVFNFFPVSASGPVTVTITQATGAVVGTGNSFQYSVVN